MENENMKLVDEGVIFTRYSGGTYIARCNGKTASCTGSRKIAAERVARKIMGDRPHTIRPYIFNLDPGHPATWQIFAEEKKI